MTPADQESLRPGFEAWYRKHEWHEAGFVFQRLEDGTYASARMADAFETWCAAKSEPVEITEDMKSRAEKAVKEKYDEIANRPTSNKPDALWFAGEYAEAILTAAMGPKFDNVLCSQCGGDFGPGNYGFSHCDNHKDMRKVG